MKIMSDNYIKPEEHKILPFPVDPIFGAKREIMRIHEINKEVLLTALIGYFTSTTPTFEKNEDKQAYDSTKDIIQQFMEAQKQAQESLNKMSEEEGDTNDN
jgi:hypothetical protein